MYVTNCQICDIWLSWALKALYSLLHKRQIRLKAHFTRIQFWPSGIVVTCVWCHMCPCVPLVMIPIVFRGDWPWSSRSNLTLCSVSPPDKKKHLPLEKIHDSHDYVDWFTVPTVSQSPSPVRTYITILRHGPDCFTVSTYSTNTNLDNKGYFGV